MKKPLPSPWNLRLFLTFLCIPVAASGNARVEALQSELIADVEILDRRKVDLGDREIVFSRIAPPDLPERPVERVARRALTEAEIAAAKEVAELEPVSLFVEATAFEEATKIRWRHEGEVFEAWSNIDFTILPGFGSLTTDQMNLTVMILPRPADEAEAQSESIPQAEDFAAGADYFIVSPSEMVDWKTFRGIEALHLHYENHEAELRSQHLSRQAAAAERERELRENPPEPEDTTIYFWPIQ